MKVLFAGDSHGNSDFVLWVARLAAALGCDRVVQVGDLGFWEHEHDGVLFLDKLNKAATETGVPWVFVDGNHDNVNLLRDRYTVRDPDGFIVVRENLVWAHRGHRWTWDGLRYASFGGAYSTDKDHRLKAEAKRQAKLDRKEKFRIAEGFPPRNRSAAGTEWFPAEEASAAELEFALRDPEPIDILVTHDRPRGVTLPNDRKAGIAETIPNQDRLQKLVTTLTPKLLVHGHMHVRYTDWIRSSGDTWTRVDGLGADDATKRDMPRPADYDRMNAVMVLDGRTGLDELLAAT
jgi:predicted phosphodiesterase